LKVSPVTGYSVGKLKTTSEKTHQHVETIPKG
jgi:hypothetical protein